MQLKAKENYGFDAKNGKWVDMFEKGIVDPTMVTRNAILNASSIAGLFSLEVRFSIIVAFSG